MIIRSVTGNIILREIIQSGSGGISIIDVSYLPDGFYIIELKVPGKDFYHSFIKI